LFVHIANLRDGFNKSCADRNENVAEVILDLVGEDVDEDEFWRRVEGNMRQGRIRMVFVADQIPDCVSACNFDPLTGGIGVQN
jgi:hypothetical protein